MGIQWRTWAPYFVHPWLRLGSHSNPFRLSLCSQPQSSPWVCPLKPVFQHPAPACTSRCESWGGECREVARTLCAGLSLFSLLQADCCTLLWASEAPFLSQLISLLVKGLPRWGNSSPFIAPFQRCRFHPDSFFFVCLFHLTLLHGNLSHNFAFMRSSASTQKVFCENCPTCRCIFDVFVGGGELHVLLFCHLDPASLLVSFNEQNFLILISSLLIFSPMVSASCVVRYLSLTWV